MKRPSFFKIGLILSIIGVVWVGFAFSDGEKISQNIHLNTAQTSSFDLELKNHGIGFYKVSMQNSKDSVMIQILDSKENIIADKKIETKMAVNFFDFQYSEVYTIKVTNLSDHSIPIIVEFGDTNVSNMINSGIVLFCGIMMIMIAGYIKLKNYKIAQPDEKIP